MIKTVRNINDQIHIDKAEVLIPKAGEGDKAIINIWYFTYDGGEEDTDHQVQLEMPLENTPLIKQHAMNKPVRSPETCWTESSFFLKPEFAFEILCREKILEKRHYMAETSGMQMRSELQEMGVEML